MLAAEKNDGPDFPGENLVQRIRKIEQLKNVTISFDQNMVQNVAVPEMTMDKEASIETLLEKSLQASNLDFKKYNDDNYSIVRKQQEGPKPEEPDEARNRGAVFGMVLDEAGEALVGVTVAIPGTTMGAITDLNGQFTLKQIPEGTYVIEARIISYQTQQVSDVQVAGGKNTRLDLVMKPASEQLSEVVVKAGYKQASAEGLYARQKSSMKMVDGISADLIKKTSDNNVAQVLKRVSGVTIDKGKYVTVRGMSERYNNVQLNGASLPSTEPNRRNFSFDVIPAALIDNVTIAKTFTPDMPGEFVGGFVEVNTLAVPEKQFFNMTVGTGMNTNSTGNDFYSNRRFSDDYLFGGVDDRKWYTDRTEEASLVNIENAGQKNTYGLQKYTAAPVQNYGLSVGLPFDLGNNQRLGVVAALTYRNEQTIEDITEAHMITRDSLYRDSWRNSFVTATGAVGNLGWEMPGHKINWRNLFNNRFTHTNQERFIHKYYETYNFAQQYSVVLQSRLWQSQLDGEHQLFGKHLQLNWNASYNKVSRTNPDDRLVTGRKNGETADGDEVFIWTSYTLVGDPSIGGSGNSLNIGAGHIMYSKLDETKKNAGADLAYSFSLGNNRQKLKAGYLGTFRSSDFEQQYLKGMYTTLEVNNWSGQAPQEMFSAERFADGSLTYVISGMEGDRADYYTGKQDVHAAYGMGEFTLLQKLHLTAGVRIEKAKTEVTTELYTSGGGVDSLVTLDKTDWLPAAALVYNLTANLNVRAAYSRTLARPDFRELSYNTYYNVDDRVWVINLGALRQSVTDNYDLRLEWFPRAGEVISIGAFYKEFTDPVELVTRMTSDHQNFYMYSANLDQATAKGLEFNIRKSLGFTAPGTFIENLYLGGNATIIEGDVTYNLDEVLGMPEVNAANRNRPLLGLSPYTVNAGLAYEGPVFGVAANYGRNGRRLVTSGDYDKYDQYEALRDVLDLQLSARFIRQKLEVKLNVSDILNQDIIVYRNTRIDDSSGGVEYLDLTDNMDYNPGDQVMSRIKRGVNLSLSVSYKF
jgi:TonB-dependent receptor